MNQLFYHLRNQKGIIPLPLLIAVIGLIIFAGLAYTAPLKNGLLSTLYQKDESQAAAPAQSGNKITWQGKQWNVTGVNIPWFNWGCDFGCNNNGGVAGTKTQIAPRFQQLKDAKLHMVRWWVFEGDNPWQITVDASGKPTGINQAVYADFDAALQLADQYDLYYNFVLFNSATAPRRSWIDDPTHRAVLAQVLGTLFDRYKNNPRVMSWEIFNEPEFQIWNGEINQANVVATGKAISDSIHANSSALSTVGHAHLDGIAMWTGAGLDYYSPHWYDYMSSGGWCARCTDYNAVKTRFGITKPVLLGEFYVGNNTADDLARFNDFYNKGYAGAWGWSLFPEKTSDKLTVNMSAALTFANSKTDVGPSAVALPSTSPSVAPSSSPAVSPSPSVSPSPAVSPSVSPSPTPAPSVKPGDIDGNGRVDIFDYNTIVTNFGKTGTNIAGDLDKNGKVDIFDYNTLVTNFGK